MSGLGFPIFGQDLPEEPIESPLPAGPVLLIGLGHPDVDADGKRCPECVALFRQALALRAEHPGGETVCREEGDHLARVVEMTAGRAVVTSWTPSIMLRVLS